MDTTADANPAIADAVPGAPTITSFTAASTDVPYGGRATLVAEFSGGTGIITPAVGEVEPGDAVATAPLEAATTFTLTVTGTDGASVTDEVEVTVRDAAIWITDWETSIGLSFGISEEGDVTPQASFGTDGFYGSLAAADGLIYATVTTADSARVEVYELPADPADDPQLLRTIEGPSTGLSYPVSVFVTDDEIYVGDAGVVQVFALAADGDAAPVRSMQVGKFYPPGLVVDDGELFLAANEAGVLVFAADGDGVVQPLRAFTSAALESAADLVLVGDDLLVVDSDTPAIHTFARDDDGVVSPRRTITGESPHLQLPQSIRVYGDFIYTTDFQASEISVWPLAGSGNLSPTRTIAGSATGIYEPSGLVIVE